MLADCAASPCHRGEVVLLGSRRGAALLYRGGVGRGHQTDPARRLLNHSDRLGRLIS